MGMQIPCGVHPEIPTQGALRFFAQTPGHIVSGVGTAEGMRDWGRAPHGRSCAYAAFDSAEVLGIASNGVYEGQERHPDCADLRREAKELCGAALLGTRLLGIDGGTQRSCRAQVYPRAREGRPTRRSVGTVRWPKPLGAAPRLIRFERFTISSLRLCRRSLTVLFQRF